MGKNVLKYCIGALALVALAVGVLYLARYIRCKQNPTCRAEKYFSELEKRYAEDTYGGNTPEETLQLFIDALKKGDVELASRYFVVEKQGEWRTKLANSKSKGFLDEMIVDLSRFSKKYPLVDGDDGRFILESFNKDGELTLQADVARGQNGRWKIINL